MAERISYLFICLIVVCSQSVNAQSIFHPPLPDKRVTIKAEQALQKITIDGRLDEADWQHCRIASGFIQSQPAQGEKAAYETEVKILYDDKNIYIGAICHNPSGKVLVQDLRRDFSYRNNELFGVFIDPFQDVQSPVQSFLVTPLSTQRDLLIYDDRIYDLDWDAVWTAKCAITKNNWSVEIAIPWSTLRYPADSTTWAINFNRNIRELNQITGWSPWPLAYTVGRMAYSGLVTNLHPPKAKANIRIAPYVLVDANKNKPDPKINNKENLGGEVKWLINTTTSLEGTINTDFAQADIDKQIINLRRSSVFLPERRQFFLENANLFSVGQDGIIQPFFSRRIGLNDNGAAQTINGGLRFIHQDAKRGIGALVIQQTDKDTKANTLFGVVRAQENLSTKARVGTLITYRYDNFDRTSNTVATLDGYFRLSEPFFIRPMVSYNLSSKGNNGGLALFTEVGYIKNKTTFQLFETYSSKNYQPKTGYLERTNFINTQPLLQFTLPVSWLQKKIRYFQPGINANIYHNAETGEWQESNLNLIPFQVMTSKGSSLAISVQHINQNIKSLYNIIPEIAVDSGKYNYNRYDILLSTNMSVPYSVIADFNSGRFYNGKLSSYAITLRAVPIPNIALALNYTYNIFSDFSLAKQKIKSHILSPECRIFFTPKVQLSTFYHYNTASNNQGMNLRFAWEYKPLSFLYLIYNSNQNIDSQGLQTTYHQQTGILKLSYIRQL